MKPTKHILLTIAMLLCSITASAHDFVVGGIYYEFNNNDVSDPTVAVTYMGNSATQYNNEYTGHVTIPSKVTYRGRTYRVTEIGGAAFCLCDKLTSITIPNSVTYIDVEAFERCSGLTSVTIPKSVRGLGAKAFFRCYNLTSVTIPEGVVGIGWSAFEGCSKLTSLTIPNSVEEISTEAFSGCSGLNTTILGKGIKTIGRQAFAGCTGELIVNCNIPTTSESYSVSTFHKNKFTKVTINEGVTTIGREAFTDCGHIESITIPESVTKIGEYAFDGCSFTSVKCPERFRNLFTIYTTVGDFVFEEGVVPRLLKYKGDSREIVLPKDYKGKKYKIAETAFAGTAYPYGDHARFSYGNPDFTSITIPEGVIGIEWGAFSGCVSLKTITIPEGCTEIGRQAFRDCSSLKSITLPKSVVKIGEQAFSGCTGDLIINSNIKLTSEILEGSNFDLIVFGGGVTKIADEALAGCDEVKSVWICDGVKSIGKSAFSKCRDLTSISIPASVTSIGEGAFGYCQNLKAVNIGSIEAWCKVSFGDYYSNPLSWADYLYLNRELVRDLVIPEGVTSIGWSAFRNCGILTSVSIPESVTSIGGCAFSGCRSLTSITLPNSVTSIEDATFSNCSSLTAITIPEGVTSIGSYAFYNCRSLTSITISKGVTSIGDEAFYKCSSLTSITILANSQLTSIGSDAFSNCSNLTSAIAHKSWKKIFKERRSEFFNGCNKLEKITYVK